MRTILAVVVVMLAWCGAVFADDERPPMVKKFNVLMITGADVAVHPWKENSAFVKEILEAKNFTVRVDENVKMFESKEELAKFDVVVLVGSFSGAKWALSDAAKANFVDFVKEGKGLYAQHYATASWGNWEEFGKMCGKRWVNGKSGHNARSVFDVNVKDAEHPIMKGLKDFKTDDELYAKLQGSDEDIHPLATALSDFSKKVEPIVFTRDYGKGRVVISNLGHDKKAMDIPEVRAIIINGIEWAASGAVVRVK